MKVLFTSPVLEHPAAGGPQLRVENSIKALTQVCELDIISRSPPSLTGGHEADVYFRSLCHEFHVAPSARYLASNRWVRKAQRILGSIGDGNTVADAKFILEHAKRRCADAIWFGFGNISFPLMRLIKSVRPDLKLVCDTDSVWSRFILRELPFCKGVRRWKIERAGRQKEAEERAWVDICDVTTAVSEVDAKYYRGIAPDPSRIHVFSNVLDLKSYACPPPPPPGFRSPSIYLAGTFGHFHSPMDTAARWMLEDVMPLLRQQIPNIHFYIVGTNSDRTLGHICDPHVTVTGRLPSVLPYLCNVDVALVPLSFESGTRFKILEAGACSIPLVSTKLGAEGIPVISGKHLLIADEPREFADAILKLVRDKAYAKELATACRELVQRDYSVEALSREAEEIFQFLRPDT